MPILLTVCTNINMKNVIKFVKSVKLLDVEVVKSAKCTLISINTTVLSNVLNDFKK